MKRLILISSFIVSCSFFSNAQIGELDPSFGGAGTGIEIINVSTDATPSTDFSTCIKVQADGKILIGGETNNDMLLIRLLPDGMRDTEFGENGFITIEFSGRSRSNDIEIQPDQKIVSGGYFNSYSGGTTNKNYFLTRHLQDGTPDNTFGPGGVAADLIAGVDDLMLEDIALQGDKKIVAVGNNYILRFLPIGAIDVAFNGVGFNQVFDGINYIRLNSVKIQDDGKIIATGTSGTSWGSKFAIIRFLPNGEIDASFSENGILTLNAINSSGDFGRELLLQPDGKLVIGGDSDNALTGGYVVARYLENGTLDLDFGIEGIVVINPTYPLLGNIKAISLQEDGKIILVGREFLDDNSQSNFIVMRLNEDGVLDSTFAQDGFQIIDVPFSNGKDVEIDNEGRIVCVGNDITNKDIIAVRILTSEEMVAIENISKKINNNVITFPNPLFGSELKIRFLDEKTIVENISLINQEGKLIQFFNKNEILPYDSELKLNLKKALPSGIYYLKIEMENKTVVKKLVN